MQPAKPDFSAQLRKIIIAESQEHPVSPAGDLTSFCTRPNMVQPTRSDPVAIATDTGRMAAIKPKTSPSDGKRLRPAQSVALTVFLIFPSKTSNLLRINYSAMP